MNINILSIFLLISSFLTILLGLFVFLKGKRSKVSKTFFTFTITIFIWLSFYSFAYSISDTSTKLFLFKVGYAGVIFIPITWYHFALSLIDKKNDKKLKFVLYIGYIVAILFVPLLFSTNYFLAELFKYSWGYYPRVYVPTHISFLAYFNTYFTLSILLLLFSFWKQRELTPFERTKRKYIFIANIVGTLAAIDFIPNYEINYKFNILPLGFIFMIGFCFITAYNILSYRHMDI